MAARISLEGVLLLFFFLTDEKIVIIIVVYHLETLSYILGRGIWNDIELNDDIETYSLGSQQQYVVGKLNWEK